MKSLMIALGMLTLLHSTISHAASEPCPQSKTIVEIAASTPGFETLVTAVKEAGLVETLNSAGPFTVFAPTNEAFAKIPQADLEALLKDKTALTNVLLYHVSPGNLTAADVVKQNRLTMANGQTTKLSVEDGMVFINSSQIVMTDIVASNGVIHVIDEVLLP